MSIRRAFVALILSIARAFRGCKHVWEFRGKMSVFTDGNREAMPVEMHETFVCKKCMRARKIRL